MPSTIRNNLRRILARYSDVRATESFGSGNELWNVFNDLKKTLSTCPSVRKRPTLRVIWSAGKGNWAKVPWIAFLDERETDTTQQGVYCVYLFRQDTSGVYLTFNQGVTQPKNQFGRIKAHQLLRDRATNLRSLCGSLAAQGFRLDSGINLRADPGLGSDYESSTIAYKFYEANLVPPDEVLLEDLERVLSVYDKYLADAKWKEAIDICWHILSDRTKFDREETEYKLGSAQQVRNALDLTRSPGSFGQLLKKAFDNPHNNLTSWQDRERFTKWVINNPERAQEAVSALLDQDRSMEERIDEFLEGIPNEAISGDGTRILVASFLLMGLDPTTYPVYEPTSFRTVERVLNWPRTLKSDSPGAVYAHHRSFAQRFLEELWGADLDARDMLDAQSLIWILATSNDLAISSWRGETPDPEKSLEIVLSWIRNLRTQASPDDLFHYKPLLLLAVLDVLDTEPDHPNSLKYGELLGVFMELAAERGSTATEEQFSQPYVRMRNDTAPLRVWIPQVDAAAIEDAKADQPFYVRSSVPAIHVHSAAWPAFRDPEGRKAIRREIQDRWPPHEVEEPSEGRSLVDLADELLVESDFLEEVVGLLRDKGQVIFYGPPGTGKTFIARKLMEHLAPQRDRREIVQFHPSYSYEDFVFGYRPITRGDNSLAYKLKPGPFMRLARQASKSSGEHILLIDEINRGNLPKILGELLYLLEYRDDEVVLMYKDDEEEDGASFSLPTDLLIIGTMNTADRSIALIDAALRRRFHFVPFFPNEWPLKGLLRRWLERHRPEMVEVAYIVDRLNAELRERFGPHLQVGPSYFMKKNLDEAVLQRVWDYDVMPFLEDQLFGQEEEIERFKLGILRGAEDANHRAEGIPAEPGTPDEE